ncbi:hypothetical protein HPP92_029006 [Vanilla planifolia]|uniref:Uncharacterized protein n=1 Tax=Vanilla planifolia TaxID=51239 RepID=A0A835P8U5_VANPL|nr:hypothetical protein HPP92_029006 [Vanilla planifolia]KAG0446112.1 hypothetical protein HPP92_028994 [Vanilla planifolia]
MEQGCNQLKKASKACQRLKWCMLKRVSDGNHAHRSNSVSKTKLMESASYLTSAKNFNLRAVLEAVPGLHLHHDSPFASSPSFSRVGEPTVFNGILPERSRRLVVISYRGTGGGLMCWESGRREERGAGSASSAQNKPPGPGLASKKTLACTRKRNEPKSHLGKNGN